ncbi:MAG: flavoprotein, partial [Acidobacteriota bacterium]
MFVGVSGASGAPYALRLVQSLAAAGCELQLSVSDNGVLVLRHELELHAESRDDITSAFLELAGATAEVYAPDDLAAPPSSGS